MSYQVNCENDFSWNITDDVRSVQCANAEDATYLADMLNAHVALINALISARYELINAFDGKDLSDEQEQTLRDIDAALMRVPK